MKITKAIIPIAGWGTRMLPITKSIEKCMLPVGLRPVVDYVVQDVIAAGIRDIYFVVSEQSSQVQTYYGENPLLNNFLKRSGKEDKLALLTPPQDVNFHFITETSIAGTSTSVAAANEFITSGESALVVMGDQFFYRKDNGSNAADLIALVEQSGVTAGLLGNPVPEERIPQFGIIEKDENNNFVRIVEKPSLEEAPSNLNNSSFYIFDKEIFELAKTLPSNPKRNEFEITDAINAYVTSGKRIVVGTAVGDYMECGSLDGWLYANNHIVDKT